MKNILIFISSIILSYFITSFIAFDFNIADWQPLVRWLMLCFIVGILMFLNIFLFFKKEV